MLEPVLDLNITDLGGAARRLQICVGDINHPESNMPHAFPTLGALHAAISHPNVRRSLERFAGRRAVSMEELVRASVGGNTFRAFQFNRFGVAGAPSEIFRSWTTQRLERDYRRLVGLASFEAMIGQLSIMATDLDAA
jgi:hypothetical protein